MRHGLKLFVSIIPVILLTAIRNRGSRDIDDSDNNRNANTSSTEMHASDSAVVENHYHSVNYHIYLFYNDYRNNGSRS